MVNGNLHVWVRSCENYGGRGLESDKMLCLFIDVGYLESIYLFNYLLIYLTIYVLIDVRYLESLRQNHSFRNMETVNKYEDRVGHLVTDPDYLKQRYQLIHISISIYPLGFISLVLDGINCAKLPAAPEMAHQVSHLSLSLCSN